MGGKGIGREASQGVRTQYPEQRVGAILAVLQETFGHAVCELDHDNVYQLIVATILSAQSTDKLVNKVTPALFARYPNAEALALASIGEVETLVHSTGFYRNKAKNIVAMAQRVVSQHEGEIPSDMDSLLGLAGVARKSANVVLGEGFGIASGVVVDTHIKRVSQRLGLTAQTTPEAIERELMKLIPQDKWIDFSQQLIWHGRRVCDAKKPQCETCSLAPLCPSVGL